MTGPLAAGLVPIPQPPPYPILGNALEMDPENPMQSLVDLHKKYGPIYVFQFPGHPEIMIGSQELAHELCDQERFKKTVGGPLGEVRQIAKMVSTHILCLGEGLTEQDCLPHMAMNPTGLLLIES